MIEKGSDTWLHIVKLCHDEIESARQVLEGINCDLRRADNARGAIAAFNLILRAADPMGTPKPSKPEDENRWKRLDRAGI